MHPRPSISPSGDTLSIAYRPETRSFICTPRVLPRWYDNDVRIVAAKQWLLDLLFPFTCVGCESEGAPICDSCRSGLVFTSPQCPVCGRRDLTGLVCAHCAEKTGLRRFFAPFSYRIPLVRNVIHTYKYEGVRTLAPFIAEEMTGFLTTYGIAMPGQALLIPIPLHPARKRERGFNQSALLAEELALRFDLKVCYALRRSRNTPAQVDMTDTAQRRENVRGAFGVPDPEYVRGKTVILVDDVSTSGATLTEAATALRSAGVRTVWAMVFARGW